MKNWSIFLSFTMLTAVLSEHSFSQKVETKDGIRFIHNKKSGEWGNNSKVDLKLIRTIGGIDVEDENYTFVGPRGIELDSAGNMYIPDYSDNKIKKFNPEGEYIKTIGRHGQGPGDFNHPYSIDIDADDNLYVLDSGNSRIQILDYEGKSQKLIPYNTLRQHTLRILDTGLMALGGRQSLRWVMSERKELPKLIELMDSNGTIKKAFGEMTDYQNRLVNYHANQIEFETDNKGNFYFTFIYQNRIDKYNPEGILLWKTDRVLNYSTEVIDKGYTKSPDGGLSIQLPKMNYVSNGIAIDKRGRVWVLTFNRQLLPEEITQSVQAGRFRKITSEGVIKKMDIYKLEIFNSEGFLLGEIQLNHVAHGIRIQKDYLFLWDAENTKYYQYKIKEK